MGKEKSNKLLFFIWSFGLTLVLATGVISEDVYATALDQAVTISAVDYQGDAILPLTAVEFEEGDTAYDALVEVTQEHDIELNAPENEYGVFVNGIGGLEAADAYYWSFIVNGKSEEIGISSYELENGDNIQLKYVDGDDADTENNIWIPEDTITVSANAGDNVIMPETTVKVVNGSTAYDALVQAADQNGVELTVAVDDQWFTSVNNIGNIDLLETEFIEFDYNGSIASVGPLSQSVQDGDTISFSAVDWATPIEEGNLVEGAPNQNNGEQINQEESRAEASSEEATNTNTTAVEELKSVQQYILNNYTPLEYGDEWLVWGLAHSNYDGFETYVDTTYQVVEENKGVLRSIEPQKLIISLSLLGYDATNFGGYNLVESMLNNNVNENTNTIIYTLLALDSGDYMVEDGVREDLIQQLLGAELELGGWSFFGETPSIDITAMALNALAPYQDNPEVQAAIERVVVYASENQDANGGYYEEFNGGYSSESVSQLITGLTAVGIDPTSDTFTKSDGNLLDYLMLFKQEDGGYGHVMEGPSNPFATQQAHLALVAYNGFLNGNGSIYTKSETPLVTVQEQVPSSEKEGELPGTGVSTIGIIIAIIMVFSGAAYYVISNRKK